MRNDAKKGCHLRQPPLVKDRTFDGAATFALTSVLSNTRFHPSESTFDQYAIELPKFTKPVMCLRAINYIDCMAYLSWSTSCLNFFSFVILFAAKLLSLRHYSNVLNAHEIWAFKNENLLHISISST